MHPSPLQPLPQLLPQQVHMTAPHLPTHQHPGSCLYSSGPLTLTPDVFLSQVHGMCCCPLGSGLCPEVFPTGPPDHHCWSLSWWAIWVYSAFGAIG